MLDLWWIPSLLLVAVAFHHRWKVHSVQQSAWQGGGFGMFSDIERNSFAAVLWVIDDDGREVPIRVDPSVTSTVISRIPTAANILRWGREVIRGEWQRCGDLAYPRPTYSTASPLAIRKMTLHYLCVTFEARRGLYTAEERRHFAIDRDTGEVANQ